jgi:hypothetical protein
MLKINGVRLDLTQLRALSPITCVVLIGLVTPKCKNATDLPPLFNY